MKSTYDNFIGVYDSIVDPSLCEKVIDFFEKSDFFPRKLENVDDKQLCMEDCRSNLSKELREPLMDCFRDYLNEYPLLRRSNFINSLTLLQKTEPTGGYHDFHTENLGWDNSSRSITWMIYLLERIFMGLKQKIRKRLKSLISINLKLITKSKTW